MAVSPGAELPRPVRTASRLLIVAAALGACGVAAAVAARQHLAAAGPAYLAALGGTGGEQARALSDLRSSLAYDLVMAALAGLVLAALAVAIRRPWRRARAVAWSVTGAFVVALAFGIGTAPEAVLSPTGLEPPAVRRALENLLADWYSTVHSVLVLGQLVILAAVMLLLLSGDADDFYSRGHRASHRARPRPGTA